MSALAHNDIDLWKKSKQETKKLADKIINRIDEIIKYIHKISKIKIYTWYFYGAGEGSIGEIKINDTYVSVEKEFNNNRSEYLISYKKSTIDIVESFPVEWLYDDSYKKIIEDGRKSYLEKEKSKELKRKENNKNKEQKLKKVKSKLTKEELRLLGIKI
jgi:hypothetical protein